MATDNAGVEYLGDGGSDGTVVAKLSTDLLGLHGKTPTSMRTGTSQAAVTVTAGTTSGSALVASLQSLATANSTLLNEIRATLVAKGIFAGA